MRRGKMPLDESAVWLAERRSRREINERVEDADGVAINEVAAVIPQHALGVGLGGGGSRRRVPTDHVCVAALPCRMTAACLREGEINVKRGCTIFRPTSDVCVCVCVIAP